MPALSEYLLAGFDGEMESTRKLLGCLPEGNMAFRPHPKSMTLGRLAGHVAELPRLAGYALERESLNIAPGQGEPRPEPFVPTSSVDALAKFDELAASARRLIESADDERLSKIWTMSFGEQTLFSLPRHEVVRVWFLHHMIHHRAQLGVYLRLLDIPIPGMYGPSADTPPPAPPKPKPETSR